MKKIVALAVAATLFAPLAGPFKSPTPVAYAQEETTPLTEVDESTTRTVAPNTDDCPHELTPPEPVTTSERLAPGQAAPTPLPPVTDAACGITAPDGFTVPDDVVASAWLIADADTGEIIAEKDPNGRYRPASIIKALLALVAIDELDLDKEITASAESAGIDGSAVGLGAGGVYTIKQLLQGLLMASGNDAAHALAQELGGDDATLTKINALAKSLGTTSTVAASYSGLDAPGMSTSAYDMALIYQAAYNDPTFTRLISTDKVDFPGYDDLPGYELWNDNGLFMNDPDGIGGKTGYTDDANHTFVGALERDGRRLFAVLLDTTVDHGPRAWQQAQALLHEAYTIAPGQGVDTLRNKPALAAAEVSPTPTPAAKSPSVGAEHETETADYTPTLTNVSPWVPWLVIGLVGVAVLAVAGISLSKRPPKRRPKR